MTDADPPGSSRAGGGGEIAIFPAARRADPPPIAFDRHELRQIMDLYGRMVALGEWRDYAIDFLRDKAIFSIFRRASEVPLYRVVKDPSLARRQGQYSVVAQTGMILKRGHDLDRVLKAIDKPLTLVGQSH
jgi:hypothetical protein